MANMNGSSKKNGNRRNKSRPKVLCLGVSYPDLNAQLKSMNILNNNHDEEEQEKSKEENKLEDPVSTEVEASMEPPDCADQSNEQQQEEEDLELRIQASAKDFDKRLKLDANAYYFCSEKRVFQSKKVQKLRPDPARPKTFFPYEESETDDSTSDCSSCMSRSSSSSSGTGATANRSREERKLKLVNRNSNEQTSFNRYSQSLQEFHHNDENGSLYGRGQPISLDEYSQNVAEYQGSKCFIKLPEAIISTQWSQATDNEEIGHNNDGKGDEGDNEAISENESCGFGESETQGYDINDPNLILECVQRNILTEMDGRDLVRCVATEKACDVDVYSCSLEKGALYRQDRHVEANFNRSQSFIDQLKKNFGDDIQFDQIILDYFWIPAGWNTNHWTRSFFQHTLVAFSKLLTNRGAPLSNKNNLCEYPSGTIFLPFCFHCFKEVVASFDALRKHYNVQFVRKHELSKVTLWHGTQIAVKNAEEMQHILGKQMNQEEIYCTFTAADIKHSMDDPNVSVTTLLDIAYSIDNFHDIRFIQLTPLPNNVKAVQNGKGIGHILGLVDPSQVRNGILSNPPSTVASSRPGSNRRLSTRRQSARLALPKVNQQSAPNGTKAQRELLAATDTTFRKRKATSDARSEVRRRPSASKPTNDSPKEKYAVAETIVRRDSRYSLRQSPKSVLEIDDQD